MHLLSLGLGVKTVLPGFVPSRRPSHVNECLQSGMLNSRHFSLLIYDMDVICR